MKKKYAFSLVGLLVSGVFLYFSLRDVNFSRLTISLKTAEPLYFIPYSVLTLLFFWLKSLRWKILLNGTKRFRVSDLFGAIMIGFGCNNIFPLRLGELIRVYIFSKWSGLSNYTVLSSIGLERLFDILGLCSLGLLVTVLGDGNIAKVRKELFVFTSFVIAALLFTIYTVKSGKKAKSHFDKLIFFLPASWKRFLAEKIDFLLHGLVSLKSMRPIIISLLNSIAQWSIMVGCIWLSAKSVGVEIPLSAAILTMLVTAFGVALPSAPAFVGTIELAFVMVLGWYQITPEKAFATAVIYHFLNFIIVTSLGIYFAYHLGFHNKPVMSSMIDTTRKGTN